METNDEIIDNIKNKKLFSCSNKINSRRTTYNEKIIKTKLPVTFLLLLNKNELLSKTYEVFNEIYVSEYAFYFSVWCLTTGNLLRQKKIIDHDLFSPCIKLNNKLIILAIYENIEILDVDKFNIVDMLKLIIESVLRVL